MHIWRHALHGGVYVYSILQYAPSGEVWDEQLMSVAQEIKSADGKPNYPQITKRILQSEPPFAGDLESHVKFAKGLGRWRRPTLHDRRM